jgi:radical SAM protein with 4Fe4S-binding SPASM domain
MSEYVTQVPAGKAELWKDKHALIGRLDIELTERCNNNCAHCYINLPADDQQAKARELSTRDLQNIMIEAAALGCLTVRFTGGEPLLRADFESLYLFARRLGLKVLLFTNATLITPYLADLLARIPPLEPIEVSVYGMSKRSYEAVSRTPGSFEAAWAGINLLLDRQIPFVVKAALLPLNRAEMDAFERWALTLPAMHQSPSYSMFFDLRSRRDSERKNALIRKLRLTPEEGVEVLTRRPEKYRRAMSEFCSKFLKPPGDKLFTCGSGVGGGCLDAYGMLQPCMLLRHPQTVYDLRQGTLKDALTRFFPELRETRATNPDYLEHCARCFLKGVCEQCPAKSWMAFGTLDTRDQYLCDLGHAQARFLGLLGENEHGWEVEDWRARIEDVALRVAAEQGERHEEAVV